MKNYFAYSFIVTLVIVIILFGLSFIPKSNINGTEIKQINIFSDLITSNEIREFFGLEPIPIFENLDTLSVSEVEDAIDSIVVVVDTTKTPMVKISKEIKKGLDSISAIPRPNAIIEIEDFSDDGYYLMPFYDNLRNVGKNKQALRIAVMGDSYIEGDIMTADLREFYQQKYSGNGVGFVPLYSQVAKYRKTIGHLSIGWTQHSILKETKRGDYLISKYSFTPAESAVAEYKVVKSRNYSSINSATFIFRNSKNTEIDILVNGEKESSYMPDSVAGLQAIVLNDSISKIKYSVKNIDGFTGYGVFLNDTTGVYVDNYAVRGSSGIFMALINENLCKELNNICPINLIVLQYGLNIATGNEANFRSYKKQMVKVINKMKNVFPGVPILMMGVPEQSIKSDGDYVANPSIAILDSYQREIAKETKIAFWSTMNAVKYYGGMAKFVENKWASKDYTHINAKGGRKIAEKLYESLEYYNPTM